MFRYLQSGVGTGNISKPSGGMDAGKERTPVLRLETQYRMHPAIGEWPSRWD